MIDKKSFNYKLKRVDVKSKSLKDDIKSVVGGLHRMNAKYDTLYLFTIDESGKSIGWGTFSNGKDLGFTFHTHVVDMTEESLVVYRIEKIPPTHVIAMHCDDGRRVTEDAWPVDGIYHTYTGYDNNYGAGVSEGGEIIVMYPPSGFVEAKIEEIKNDRKRKVYQNGSTSKN